MHAYRYGEDKKEDKADSAHGVAEEPCVGFFWHHGVECDVARNEPKIDNAVQSPGEQHASQPSVHCCCPAKQVRNDATQQFNGNSERCPEPKQTTGTRREHRQWDRHISISYFPNS